MLKRCEWCLRDQLYIDYHDKEWGVPLHDDRQLFRGFLCWKVFQAGLSWYTVLSKREAYREAYDQFDPELVARYDSHRVEGI